MGIETNERIFTPAELAKRYKCDPRTVANKARRGEIRFFRVGKMLRFTESAVAEFERGDANDNAASRG